MKRKLEGQTIVITRDLKQSGSFVNAIREAGGNPVPFPTIRIEAAQDLQPFINSIKKLRTNDWIVFSSVNAVRFGEPVIRKYLLLEATINIAAIGPKTCSALKEKDISVDLEADPHTAAGLLDGFARHQMQGVRVSIPSSNLARDELADGLTGLGAEVFRDVVYHTIPNRQLDGLSMLNDIITGRIDCLTFFSPSAFRSFIEVLPEKGQNELKNSPVALASIGPTTSKAITEAGLKVTIQARKSTSDHLLNAILDHYLPEPVQEKRE